MTVCICCNAEEKILKQNAFAYDKWSVSHFLPVTSSNVHRFKKKFFTSKFNNKSVVKWLLNSPPHVKHVATLPCDLSLITMHASNFRQFSNIDVSQGSSETRLRCGGIANDHFVAYLPVNLKVKKLWKSVNIWQSYGQYYSGLFFFYSQCTYYCDAAK